MAWPRSSSRNVVAREPGYQRCAAGLPPIEVREHAEGQARHRADGARRITFDQEFSAQVFARGAIGGRWLGPVCPKHDLVFSKLRRNVPQFTPWRPLVC